MRRKPLAAMFVLLSAALVLGGNALLDAGWGSALRSIADRVLPNPEIAMWAPAPEPGSHASSYADATGAGANLDWQPFLGHFSQRLRPAFRNSTGLMYPSVECIRSLLYHHT